MAWPTAIRTFSAAVALWSATQVVYLAITFAMSPPSSPAELMSTHDKSVYVAFLVVPCIAFVFFGLVASLSGYLWRRLFERYWYYGEGEFDFVDAPLKVPNVMFFALFYVSLALTILIIFLVSLSGPKYEVFVDLSSESIFTRDTHLLPAGVQQKTVLFAEIEVITGEFSQHGSTNYYNYKLYGVTREGDRFVLGQDFPRQSRDAEPPHEASSLAQAIVGKCGAKVNLK